MATASWQSHSTVEAQLFTEAYRFEFYQAVKLLKHLAKEANNFLKVPVDLKYVSKVGTAFPASDIDDVRLLGVIEVHEKGQRLLKRVELKEIWLSASPTFPGTAERILTWNDLKSQPPLTTEIVEVTWQGQVGRLQRIELTVAVNFMGLTGAHGPLPMPYTELLLDRIAKKDFALRDFLDIFNHRLVSLFYRARQTQRLGLEMEVPWHSHFSNYLLALMGFGMPSLQQRLSMPSYSLSQKYSLMALAEGNKGEEDRSFDAPLLLFYAGLFAHQSRSLAALENLLSHLFQVAVKTEPWLGQWHPLPADQISRLGRQLQPLKERPVLGTKIWDQQGKFGLHLGPLNLSTFLDFLPESPGFQKLCEITRLFVGPELDFDLNLKLAAIPETCLHPNTDKEKPKLEAKLGRTAWLKTQDRERETVVKIGNVAAVLKKREEKV